MAPAIASLSIGDQTYLQKISQAVIQTRTELVKSLDQLGFETIPSSANFIFTKHPQHDASKIATSLRDKHIIVRYFKMPRIDQHLRITIGTDDQCAKLIEALKEII
ncbi:MAG: aminotransferase class I/II-fold pyridoxal phosphate-dependent enzyme [Polynucleobacter victoriensis]